MHATQRQLTLGRSLAALALVCSACAGQGAHPQPQAAPAIPIPGRQVEPAAAESAAADSCLVGAWSVPRALRTREGHAAWVDSPALVPAGRGLALLGTPSMVFDDTSSPPRVVLGGRKEDQLAGMMLGGDGTATPLPAPEGVRFLMPRGVADEHGAIHVLWGESRDTTQPFPIPSEIWYSAFTGQWSKPIRVAGGHKFYWPFIGQVNLDGAVVVAVPAWDSVSGKWLVAVLRLRDGRWDTRAFEPISKGVVTYAALARGRGDTLLLALVAGVPSGGGGLFVLKSPDRGATWSSPTAVKRFLDGMAYEPWLLSPGQGDLLLLWRQRFAGPSLVDSVPVVATHDGGATWSPVPGFSMGTGLLGLRAQVRADGRAEVVAAADDSFGGHVVHAVLTERGWVSRSVPESRLLGVPSLGTDYAGRSVITWLVRLRTGPDILATLLTREDSGGTCRPGSGE